MDPELRQLVAIIRILDELNFNAQNRVVSYLNSRYTT